MIYRFGLFELDEDKRELRRGGEQVTLQPLIFDLLALLVQNHLRVVSKDELLEALWPDVTVTEASLHRAISLVRSALCDDSHSLIATFAGHGYRLCADVAIASTAARERPPLGRRKSQIRFCTTPSGIRLAYSTMGEGPPLIVVPSYLSHLEMDEQIVPTSFFDALARGRQLIRYDKRGMGLSTRGAGDYSLDAQVGDLQTLVQHLGFNEVTLFGSSQGGTIVIAYAAQYPKTVSYLVLFGAYHSIPATSQERIAAILALMRADWGRLGTAPLLELYIPGASVEVREQFARYQREAATGEDAAAIFEAMTAYDVTSLLPKVRAPTLVVHRQGDRTVNIAQGRDIASQIPGARFVALDGQIHLPYWGETEPLLQTIEEFLSDTRSG